MDHPPTEHQPSSLPPHLSAAVLAARRVVINSLMALLEERQPTTATQAQREDYRKKLPMLVQRLEEALFKSSESLESYCDESTLKTRLKQVVDKLNKTGHRKRTAPSSSSHAPPPPHPPPPFGISQIHSNYAQMQPGVGLPLSHHQSQAAAFYQNGYFEPQQQPPMWNHPSGPPTRYANGSSATNEATAAPSSSAKKKTAFKPTSHLPPPPEYFQRQQQQQHDRYSQHQHFGQQHQLHLPHHSSFPHRGHGYAEQANSTQQAQTMLQGGGQTEKTFMNQSQMHRNAHMAQVNQYAQYSQKPPRPSPPSEPQPHKLSNGNDSLPPFAAMSTIAPSNKPSFNSAAEETVNKSDNNSMSAQENVHFLQQQQHTQQQHQQQHQLRHSHWQQHSSLQNGGDTHHFQQVRRAEVDNRQELLPLGDGNKASSSGGKDSPNIVFFETHNPAELLRQQQQRLLLLRHAYKCNEGASCKVSKFCDSTKKLWEHIRQCEEDTCDIPHCLTSRVILYHYHRCKDTQCLLCNPLRSPNASYSGNLRVGGGNSRSSQVQINDNVENENDVPPFPKTFEMEQIESRTSTDEFATDEEFRGSEDRGESNLSTTGVQFDAMSIRNRGQQLNSYGEVDQHLHLYQQQQQAVSDHDFFQQSREPKKAKPSPSNSSHRASNSSHRASNSHHGNNQVTERNTTGNILAGRPGQSNTESAGNNESSRSEDPFSSAGSGMSFDSSRVNIPEKVFEA